jgi:hypothetical protein
MAYTAGVSEKGICNRYNTVGESDMGISALSVQPAIVGQRGFVIITIQYIRLYGKGIFIISTILQLFITRGICYQHSATGV